VGKGDTMILESCEYCNSFHSFFPTVAIILNVEADHLDFFSGLEDVKHSFRTFADLVPERGHVVANMDNANTMDALKGYAGSVATYSVHNEQAFCHAKNIVFEKGLPSFDVVISGEHYAHVSLQVGGEHNISNALAAACAAWVLNVPGKAVEEGLGTFVGAGRRFERKGFVNGAVVYDDYAHHPGELDTLLDSAHQLGYRRVICAFQPHTYTRTHELFDDFVEVLKKPDITILAEIFAAREENTIGISSNDLVKQIPDSIYCSTLEDVASTLKSIAQPGDLILTVGAGDIYRAGEMLVNEA
jgi:UDP-N-acetylmuramate--alanine ligase